MPYRLVELQCYELPGNWVTLSSGYCDKGDAELLTVMGSRCADGRFGWSWTAYSSDWRGRPKPASRW
jgi:hypothetical protein